MSLLLSYGTARAQQHDTRFGLLVSPAIIWMKTDDNLVNSNGVRAGLKIGGILEHDANHWLSLYAGASFSMSHGGKLLHKFGGNLLPRSRLSDSQFNTGEKPLPDDVNITYRLQLFEVPLGLRYSFEVGHDKRIYLIFPELVPGIVGRVKGDIQATALRLEREKLGRDVKVLNLAWGMGAGLELIDRVQLGLHYQGGMSDLTRNNGTRVMSSPAGGVSRVPEDSRAVMQVLSLRLAYMF